MFSLISATAVSLDVYFAQASFTNINSPLKQLHDTNNKTINERISLQKKQDQKQQWILRQSCAQMPKKMKVSKQQASVEIERSVPRSSLRIKERSFSTKDQPFYDFKDPEAELM